MMDKPEVTMMSREAFEKLCREAHDDDVGPIDTDELDMLEEHGLSVPVVKDLDAEILKAIEHGGKLNMGDWHDYDAGLDSGLDGEARARAAFCGTTHCRAGWAIHLAGEAGWALEKVMSAESAGACIYLASTGRVPDFYAENEDAMEDIKCCAGRGE